MTWRPIPGYEGNYLVSDMGEVMSLSTRNGRKPCVMQQSMLRGYQRVLLRRKQFSVHTLVLLAFVGPCPEGMQRNHRNGIKSDNRLENLEYCTASENRKHAFAIGLDSNKGERHSRHKLTDEKVREIRKMLNLGFTQPEIGELMGVCQSNISLIKSGKRWTHVIDLSEVL